MILAALACPVFTSCYDDSALNDRIDRVDEELGSLKDKVEALEKRLNDEVAALQTLIESGFNSALYIEKFMNKL